MFLLFDIWRSANCNGYIWATLSNLKKIKQFQKINQGEQVSNMAATFFPKTERKNN